MVAEVKRAGRLHNTIVAAYQQTTAETAEIKTLEADFQELMSNLIAEKEISETEPHPDKSEKPETSEVSSMEQ